MNPEIKRLLSMFMALIMVFSMITPVSVSAAGNSASNNAVTLNVGKTQKLNVPGVHGKITWTSSDAAIAAVSSNGTVTGVAPGTATVTASYKVHSGFWGSTKKTSSFTVTVTNPKPQAVTVMEGKTLQLNVSAFSAKVSWSSSDPGIATVNKSGQVKGIAPGTAIITAKITRYHGFKGSKTETILYQVTVTEAPKPEAPVGLTVTEGETLQLTIGEKNKKVTWNSSDTKIATVSNKGLVTAIQEGQVTITATVKKHGGTWFPWWGHSADKTTVHEFPITVLPKQEQPTEPVETEPVETEPVETEPVETEPVETEPVETEPVETEPVETEPVETEPVETEPEQTPVTITLRASQTEYSTQENGTIYFYAEVTGSVDSVSLICEETGETVLELLDDGKYSVSGDDLPGDNVYSGVLVIDTSAAATFHYSAKANNSDELISEAIQIVVISGFTDEQLEEMETVDLSIQDDIFSADGYEEMSSSDRVELASEVLDELAQQNLIEEDSIIYDENTETYAFMYQSGALGAVILKDWSADHDGTVDEDHAEPAVTEPVETESAETEPAETEPAETEPAETEPTETEPAETEPTETEPTETEPTETEPAETEPTETEPAETEPTETEPAETEPAETTPRDERRSGYVGAVTPKLNASGSAPAQLGEAIVLWSFEQAWDEPSFRVPFYEELESDFDALGLETTVDWDTTVDDYKHLHDYEVIMFSGHGAYTAYSTNTSSGYQTQWLPSLLLYEPVSASKDSTYENDLKAFRVGKISVKGGTMYAILPNFFTDYYDSGDLDGSFVFIQDCESHGANGNENFLFANALRAASAEAVVGYHNSVYSNYGRNFMRTYIEHLIDGDTARVSFNAAVSTHGSNDGGGAYPIFTGNDDAILVREGIKNGDFEDASTAVYWTQSGDVRILSQLDALSPVSKQRMAILTTGIGSAEEEYLAGTEGSILSQTFRIPENATHLSFSYNVVSEEPLEYVGSQYNDTFAVKMRVGTNTYTFATEDVNSSTWYEISGPDFDGGDTTTYHTTWKTVSVDISSYAGQIVTLQFMVYDMGDSIYDTAALIDQISIS